MSFSDSQTRRLRARMRAYREREGLKELGRPLPWKTIDARISIKTRVAVDDERLRQFVEGVPQKGDPHVRHFPVPEPHKLEAIRDFLMHDSIRYLAAHELEQTADVHYAAQSLLEFFGGQPEKITLTASRLPGMYREVRGENGSYASMTLTITRASGLHVCEVALLEEHFRNPASNSPLQSWSEPVKRRSQTFKKSSNGWAVSNRDGQTFIFLLEPYGRRYHSFLVLRSGGTGKEEWLLLLHYGLPQHFPIVNEESVAMAQALDEIRASLLRWMTKIEIFE